MAISAKNLNTRVALKYDSYENWQLHDPILLKGELAIAHLPEGNTDASGSNPAIQNTPNLLIKVGDGVNHYKDLKFVSALAADVYAWAKAATPPDASTIPNLDKFISDAIQDTDTQYQIVAIEEGYSYKLQSKTLNGSWTDVEGSTITLTKIDERLDKLEAAIAEGGSVDDAINEAIQGLDKDDTAVAGQFVTAVSEADGVITVSRAALTENDIPELPQSKVTGLETALAGKQDNLEIADGYNASTNKVATQETVSNAIAALDGKTAADASSATKIVAEVTQTDGIVTVQKVPVADILPDVDDTENGFVVAVKQTNGAISVTHASAAEVLDFAGEYSASNPIATKDYVTEAVADLNGAMHFIGSVAADPTVTAPTLPEGKDAWKAGDVVIFGVEEFVFDGTSWLELGNESLYAIDSEVDAEFVKVRQEMATQKSALQKEIDDDVAAAKTELTGEINKAIQGLDKTDTAVTGQFVTAVSEADGVITVSRASLQASDIPTIAQSQVDGLETALAGKQDNLVIADDYNAANNMVATQTTVSNAIKALDYSIAEEDNAVISAFTVTDGVLETSSVKKVTLHKVATSGKVEELDQEALVIINCGTANTNITASDAAALSIPNAS